MIPLSFDIANCNDLITDERRRVLGSEARKFAEEGLAPRTKWKWADNYWSNISKEHERIYWMDCYKRRLARLKRKEAS